MGLSIVTPPVARPIDVIGLNDIKKHLREATDVADENALVTAYVAVAWDYCQRLTWRQFITCGFQLTVDSWLAQSREFDRRYSSLFGSRRTEIHLPKPPTTEVTLVEQLIDEEWAAYESSDWVVDLTTDVAILRPSASTNISLSEPVRISFTAGYGTTLADMPPVFAHAVRLLTGQYFECREPEAANTTTVDALLDMIRVRDDRLAML